jgi:hypothetical protein
MILQQAKLIRLDQKAFDPLAGQEEQTPFEVVDQPRARGLALSQAEGDVGERLNG